MFSHIICITLQSFIAYLLIKHYCTRVETVTPDQEAGEHESETVGDDASFETQGRHLSILVLYFGSMKFIRVSIVHELLLYQCLIRTYLILYQPCLEHYHLGEYA